MTAPAATGELLSLPQIAARCQVKPGQVARWLKGIRVGGRTVRLAATTCYGTRVRVSAADLAAFEAECRRAKFGDGAAATVPVETPALRTRRGREAKERLAKLLDG